MHPAAEAGKVLLRMLAFAICREAIVSHVVAIDGVDGSRFRHRNMPHWVLLRSPMKGAIDEGDYHGRAGSGQVRLPGSRD
jgi:hypothetical protein